MSLEVYINLTQLHFTAQIPTLVKLQIVHKSYGSLLAKRPLQISVHYIYNIQTSFSERECIEDYR